MAEKRKRMTFLEAVRMVRIVYEGAKSLSFVKNPLSYAVHMVYSVRRTINGQKRRNKKK